MLLEIKISETNPYKYRKKMLKALKINRINYKYDFDKNYFFILVLIKILSKV